MRTLAILLVVTAAALAQDDGGAALFYKAFWLEQAEGRLDEAAALYGNLLAEKPGAPEAPRALLGLVRIKVAKGEDASELVAALERRYPDAKDEIAGARKLAVREEFDPEHRPGDSPVAEKLKSLLTQAAWTDADRLFLVDLGAAAHPMLARLLRSTADGHVQRAAAVLVEQRTPEAYGVLAAALLDDAALFRSTIVEQLRQVSDLPAVATDALGKLYDRSAPRLRVQAVATLASVAFGDGREIAFATLTRALADRDEEVRTSAMLGVGNPQATDAYLEEVLRTLEARETEVASYVVPYLLRFADRAAFLDRIEGVLEARGIHDESAVSDLPDEGGLLLARVLVRNAGKGVAPSATLVTRAVTASPRAAALLLLAAIETNEPRLAKFELSFIWLRRHLGEEANRVRAAAIAAASGIDETLRETDGAVLKVVGVAEADVPSIVEGLRRRGEKRFPQVLLDKDRLWALGPGKAGALAEFCRSERDVNALLHAGMDFAGREDAGVEFFRVVLPKVGPGAASDLRTLVARKELVGLVADRLVSAQGPEWGWGAELRAENGWYRRGTDPVALSPDRVALSYPGPYVWLAVRRTGTAGGEERGKLLRHVGDPRPEIAIAAAGAAAAEKSEAGTEALKLALHSATPAARAIALDALVDRVADGPALVREFAKRPNLSDYDRDAVAGAVWKGTAYSALAAELIRAGTWPGLWPVYQQIAPTECVELALIEALGERGGDHRLGAVRVLTELEDPRRIEAFRKVLKGTDRAAILEVLGAVRDQYLVELGEEALAQLRNPDANIRAVATEAIDKLKFYAEAKKAFEK
ncbi:MAG: hypothetical protein L6Q95_01945 [Planctomycetes bacterium]|nr:hypothetical protein [Planctomycetota bacterium]